MAQTDKHETFMRLLVANQPKIYAAIRSLGLNRHDAEDVLQDSATVLWRRFDEFEEGTHFDRWACKVARLQALSFRQRARRACPFDEQVMEMLIADSEQMQTRLSGMHEELDACLEKLPQSERRMLNERFVAQRTLQEIGKLLERSESAVSRSLSRVYNKLLDCLRSRSGLELQREV